MTRTRRLFRHARYPGLAISVAVIVLFGIGVGAVQRAQPTALAAQAAGLALDASVQTHQGSPSTSITSGAISTTVANDLLVAFITSDGPAAAGAQSFSAVTGGGLAW